MLPVIRFAQRVAASMEVRIMVKNRFARKWLSALLIAAGTLGAVAIPQSSAAAVDVIVKIAPPAPRVERVPVPRVDRHPNNPNRP